MSDPNTASQAQPGQPADREQKLTALFTAVVMQQTNMALMFLGKAPNPETGRPIKDLEAAQMFIDTLEMLEEKTRGNLNEEQKRILRESLTAVRLAFVEAVNEPTATEPPKAQATPDQGRSTEHAETGEKPSEEEPRKRFTKKY